MKVHFYKLTMSNVLQNLYQSRFLGLAAMASPSRTSQNRRRCKNVTRFSFIHPNDALALPRSTSDTDLVSFQSRSTLTVSTSLYCIDQSEDIIICWDIKEEVDAGDWIGMYLIGEIMSTDWISDQLISIFSDYVIKQY